VGLAFLDETAVVAALRAIEHDFSATGSELQWVMAGYLLSELSPGKQHGAREEAATAFISGLGGAMLATAILAATAAFASWVLQRPHVERVPELVGPVAEV
jgi:hypothetical protein